MRYSPCMAIRSTILAVMTAASLQACVSVDLPNVDFMGDTDFSEDIEQLDSSFPSADETPDIPTDVRTAKQWDDSARQMQTLYDEVNVPELEPALSAEEFQRRFEAAQEAANEYKEDDPS